MITIIIINYRSTDYLQKLLHSIDAYHSGLSREIIIVNNSPEEISAITEIRMNIVMRTRSVQVMFPIFASLKLVSRDNLLMSPYL